MPPSIPSPKRLRLYAFVALAFAFWCTQQWAVRHWTLHAAASAIDAPSSKASATAERCDECIALSAFVGAAPAATMSFVFEAPADPLRSARPCPAASQALRLAFRARAPPVPS